MNIIVTALFTLTLASWASASDGRTNSFSCDFESPGMQSFCHWNIDPRDSGAMWGIVWSPNLHTNMLCLTPTALSLSAAGVYTDGDDDAFDLGEINATAMRARFWSPKFRIAWTDVVPRCINFLFKFDQPVKDSPLSLSLMFHSSSDCIQVIHPKTGKPTSVCSNEDIWKTTGSTLGWQNAKIDLTSAAKSDFQIILEGVIPAGYPDARICVDNITSYTVPCSELEPKPLKPSTAKYTWAQYFGITFIVALAFGLLIPVLFLVGIIVVCRRRHAYRHHHCMTNGSGGGMSVSGAGSGSYGNSKLFSANLWHYIGGKEVDDDPFAEHTASIHRPPFSAHKFSDGTLGMRGDGTLDLPDVVIPSGRVVGGTLIRQTSQPAYNGAPYGYQTMVTTGKAMRYNGVPMGPPSNMLASQPNFTMDFNSQSAMPNMVQQGSQQMMIPIAGAPAPSQVMVQTDAAQQMMVQPANYFQSLAQPATPLSGSGAQPVMIAPAPAATGAITMTTSAVPVAAPAGANVAMDDNGPFVLPDPPSDHQQERDQVAAALDALNAATEPPQPHQTTSAAAVASGEHPPPGYDEAVGMAITRPAGGADAAAAPVLPPRRTAPANNAAVAAESLSLAQRYGLPVAEI